MEANMDEIEKNLIEEVKAHPELYDFYHHAYNDIQQKQHIFNKLSAKFKLDAKQKWKSLRDRYVRERKKINHKRKGENILTSSWKYFVDFQFLNEFLRPSREPIPNIMSTTSDYEQESVYCDSESNKRTQIVEYEIIKDSCDVSDASSKNDEFHLDNKCGQVFFTNGYFYFSCEFCKTFYDNIEIYMDHALKNHLTGDLQKNTDKFNDDDLNSPEIQHQVYYIDSENDDTKPNPDPVNAISEIKTDCTETEEDCRNFIIEEFVPDKLDNTIEEFDIISEISDSDNSQSIKRPNKIKNDYGEYECTACEKSYKIYKSLMHHFRLQHNILKCIYCARSFPNKLSLEAHISGAHADIDNIDEIELKNTPALQSTFADHHDPVRIKNAEGRYMCSLCDATYIRFENIKNHYKITHLGDKKLLHKCDQCEKTFKLKFSLMVHKNVHKGIRPYKCKYCSADFTNPQYLAFHVRIHTDDKRYKCDYCTKRFIRKFEKIFHERSMHTGEKPYQCDDCGKTFSKHGMLNVHKNRLHNPNYVRPTYHCDVCDKIFLNMESLKDHRLIHTGEKPHQCNTCLVKFRKRSNLKTHEKIHSGVKSYICKVCNKAFAQRPGLYSHMKTHKIVTDTKTELFAE